MDSPDDQARLFYLLLLGLFVGGSLLYSQRNRLGRTARDAVIWLLIFAMVVIAYGFRDTLRAGLFPSQMIQRTDGTIELQRESDGHFHATLEVDGTPIRFVIDTGASDIVLSRSDATKAGIDLSLLDFSGRALTANGEVPIARVRLEEVQFGSIVDRNVTASVGAGELHTSLLGMSYLKKFPRLEILGDRMFLHR